MELILQDINWITLRDIKTQKDWLVVKNSSCDAMPEISKLLNREFSKMCVVDSCNEIFVGDPLTAIKIIVKTIKEFSKISDNSVCESCWHAKHQCDAAAMAGHLNCLKLLHLSGIEFTSDTAYWAAWGKHIAAFKYIVDNGGVINAQCEEVARDCREILLALNLDRLGNMPVTRSKL